MFHYLTTEWGPRMKCHYPFLSFFVCVWVCLTYCCCRRCLIYATYLCKSNENSLARSFSSFSFTFSFPSSSSFKYVDVVRLVQLSINHWIRKQHGASDYFLTNNNSISCVSRVARLAIRSVHSLKTPSSSSSVFYIMANEFVIFDLIRNTLISPRHTLCNFRARQRNVGEYYSFCYFIFFFR